MSSRRGRLLSALHSQPSEAWGEMKHRPTDRERAIAGRRAEGRTLQRVAKKLCGTGIKRLTDLDGMTIAHLVKWARCRQAFRNPTVSCLDPTVRACRAPVGIVAAPERFGRPRSNPRLPLSSGRCLTACRWGHEHQLIDRA